MASDTPKLLQIHIPPSLQGFAVSKAGYLAAHPEYDTVAVGAFIFDRPSDKSSPNDNPRLLLVQRAATERGFPNRWEVPGGSSENSDPTIFHSLARETFEETGLKLVRIVRALSPVQFETGSGGRKRRWNKLSFEIEVADHHALKDQSSGVVREESQGEDSMIQLDPLEHQACAWVSLAEIEEDKYPITVPDQCELYVKVFKEHADILASKHNDSAATTATAS